MFGLFSYYDNHDKTEDLVVLSYQATDCQSSFKMIFFFRLCATSVSLVFSEDVQQFLRKLTGKRSAQILESFEVVVDRSNQYGFNINSIVLGTLYMQDHLPVVGRKSE